MAENIAGIFKVDVLGKDREAKYNFGVMERLERDVFKRPLAQVLNEALNGQIFGNELVDTILVGLEANKDTRFKREQIGEYIVEKGIAFYQEFYLEYLTYAIVGKTGVESLEVVPDSKKK